MGSFAAGGGIDTAIGNSPKIYPYLIPHKYPVSGLIYQALYFIIVNMSNISRDDNGR